MRKNDGFLHYAFFFGNPSELQQVACVLSSGVPPYLLHVLLASIKIAGFTKRSRARAHHSEVAKFIDLCSVRSR